MTIKVLIVDDEAPIRRIVRRYLEGEGVEIVEAATAQEALVKMDAERDVAVVMSDLRMPDHDGLWLAERLRERYQQTAVVMMTAVHEFGVAVSSIQTGVVDYVQKPFTRERVVEALQRALLAHRFRRAVTASQRELEQQRARITAALAELEANAAHSIRAILTMLQASHPGAYDRAHRVAQLAVSVAMAMEVKEPVLSEVERAALLHELPQELRGTPSPLAARIARIVAAFDDLTSDRGECTGDALQILMCESTGDDDARVIETIRMLLTCRVSA